MSNRTLKKATNKDTVKNDIAEKVKEIKARQQNWFKQREDHISNSDKQPVRSYSSASTVKSHRNSSPTTKPTSNKVTSIHKNASNGSSVTSIRGEKHVDSEKTKNNNNNTKNAQRRFQDWMHAREVTESKSNKDTCVATTTEENDGPDLYSNGYCDNSSAMNNSRSRTRSDLSPDMFDKFADEIVNRVKREMKMSHDNDVGLAGRGEQQYADNDGDSDKHLPGSDDYLESHFCPRCNKLMLPPGNSPMLVVPCGHTLCEACCCASQQCWQCHCQVTSVTGNIMLQQIINQHRKSRSRKTGSASKHGMKAAYHAGDYSEGINYQEEYRNLCTRCEVLDTEAGIITESLSNIEGQIDANKEQMRGIDREEKKLEDQMRHLEEKLLGLRNHREGYRMKCDQLEGRQFEESNRLALVQETLQSLHQQIEKVKLLADR